MKFRWTPHSLRSQTGQAMAEFLYALPILLLLTLGAIQVGFIYQAKLTLNYAANVGVREGAVNGGNMSAILSGIEAGLAPLYAHSLGQPRDMAMLKQARKDAHDVLADSRLTKVTIVSPSKDAYNHFQQGGAIPNDNLMYRDPAALSSGAGSVNIQDANLLKIHVQLCYRLFVPIINKLIYNLAVDPPGSPPAIEQDAPGMLRSYGAGSTTRRCTNRPSTSDYYLPIEAEAIMRMQSPFKNDGGKWVAPT